MLKKFTIYAMLVLAPLFIFTQNIKAQDEEEPDVVGFVKSETADIYEKADEKSPLLLTIKKGQIVLVLDSKTNKDWWKVFSSEGKEGWVKADSIGLPTSDSATYRMLAKDISPSVRVTNQTKLTLSITIGGATHKIPGGKQKVLSFKPGAYPYTVRAPGFAPSKGTKVFEGGMFYTWRFAIKTTRVIRRRK